jgi:hypothetical protein
MAQPLSAPQPFDGKIQAARRIFEMIASGISACF